MFTHSLVRQGSKHVGRNEGRIAPYLASLSVSYITSWSGMHYLKYYIQFLLQLSLPWIVVLSQQYMLPISLRRKMSSHILVSLFLLNSGKDFYIIFLSEDEFKTYCLLRDDVTGTSSDGERDVIWWVTCPCFVDDDEMTNRRHLGRLNSFCLLSLKL